MKKVILFFAFFFLVFPLVFSGADTVNLVTLNWAPFLGKDMQDGGFVAQVVRKAFASQGDDVVIQFYPWGRCMALAEDGRVDGVIGAWYNDERATKFYYSEPLLTNRKIFFTTRDSNVPASFSSLNSLSAYTIGTVKGYTYTEDFDNADFLSTDASPDLKVCFEKLFAGRNDIVVGAYYPALYILENDFPMFRDEVKVLKPALKEDPLYVIFSQAVADGSDLRARFDAGLQAIKDDGTYDAILEEYGF